MISSIISRLVILVFGTLYPAYASYKAVKSKNVREYVKWMMYWIVFAFFTCVETITDVFLSWFPFYYEIKIILVIWLLSPATKGSSFLYRKFVHPMLSNREQEIDEYITKAKEQSYKQVLDLGSKGVNALMQTALKSGGGLVNQIKKSYSLSDLTDRHTREEGIDETDVMITDTRLMRKRQSPRRGPTPPMYFSEIDVRTDAIVSVQSVEDISSSGYSSGEGLTNQSLKLQAREGLVRSGSIGSSKARPTRLTRSTVVPKKSSTTDDDSEAVPDGQEPDVIFFNDRIESIDNLPVGRTEPSDKSESSSDGEFVDTVESKSELEELNQTGKSNNIIEPATKCVTFKNIDEIIPATNPIAFTPTELTVLEQATNTIADSQKKIEPILEPATNTIADAQKKTEPILEPATNTIAVLQKETELTILEPDTNINAFSESKEDALNISESASKTEIKEKTSQDIELIDKQELKTVNDNHLGKSDSNEQTNVESTSKGLVFNSLEESSLIEPDTEILAFYDVPDTIESRGGKYHKKTAPEPPAAITATLVLKPGVVKTLDDNHEIFCNSPKSKRRSLSKSRSPSPSRKKKESPMTRIMLLPRKMGGFLKHGSLVELRSSSDENLAAARSTASLTSVPEENKKSIKQFFQRRKHE